MNVMIVDDSMTMRRIIAVNLKKAGINDIIEAENGRNALDILGGISGKLPDVMLLDWNMPEMSGIDLLKTLKADARLKSIPVIMVTTEAEKERVTQAVQLGASGYLVKPLTPEAFQKYVVERLKPQ